MKIQEIGIVENQYPTSIDPEILRKEHSEIIIHEPFADGLYRLEEHSHIVVVFYFNQSKEYALQSKVYSGEHKGIFASRSPKRPSMIGVSTVKLLKREGNKLCVQGLDALHGTPVLDIKPFIPSLDSTDVQKIEDEKRKNNPRLSIMGYIRHDNVKELLLLSGQIHGHYCPGLALGVIVAYLGMKQFNVPTEGLEDLVAIVEVNSCFVDGIQCVAGCTIGNNGLIFRDIGKTAVTFADRKTERSFRYRLNDEYVQTLDQPNREHSKLMVEVIQNNNRDPQLVKQFKESSLNRAFSLLKSDFNALFTVQEGQGHIPKTSKLFRCFLKAEGSSR